MYTLWKRIMFLHTKTRRNHETSLPSIFYYFVFALAPNFCIPMALHDVQKYDLRMMRQFMSNRMCQNKTVRWHINDIIKCVAFRPHTLVFKDKRHNYFETIKSHVHHIYYFGHHSLSFIWNLYSNDAIVNYISFYLFQESYFP